jgi:hypothetical protein
VYAFQSSVILQSPSPVMVPERTAVGVTQMASLKKCNFAEVDSESQG